MTDVFTLLGRGAFFRAPLGTQFRALVGQPRAPTLQSWLRIPGVDRQPGRLRPRRRLHTSQPRRGSADARYHASRRAAREDRGNRKRTGKQQESRSISLRLSVCRWAGVDLFMGRSRPSSCRRSRDRPETSNSSRQQGRRPNSRSSKRPFARVACWQGSSRASSRPASGATSPSSPACQRRSRRRLCRC
jgi:hypothetical protein